MTILALYRLGSALCLTAAVMCVLGCTSPFDMTGERIPPPGPEWGVVIGSVLVQPETDAVVRDSYEFEIVQIQPGDPDGTRPYADEYRLTAKAGEERVFVSRLRPGDYLIRSFHKASVIGLGGELDVVFSAGPGEVRYVGRVRVHIPRRPSKGNEYHFSIDNVRAQTLAEVAKQHPQLADTAVDSPIRTREHPVP